MSGLGWWSISGADLMAALHRVAAGADPDLTYTELYANSDIEPPAGDEDGGEG